MDRYNECSKFNGDEVECKKKMFLKILKFHFKFIYVGIKWTIYS